MTKETVKNAAAGMALAAALAVLPCGTASAAQGEPDWLACDRQEGIDRVQACRERIIAWWERRLDAAAREGALQCSDIPCRARIQQSMDAWDGYRDAMSRSAAEAAGSYKLGISMEQASAEMRYRLTREQTIHIESLYARQQTR